MTPWRKELHKKLADVPFSGRVLDLGGDKRSEYQVFLKSANVEVVNIAKDAQPDHTFDLENTFPLPNGTYDFVMCMNILEHIYNTSHFLSECRRVLKPGGTLVVAVPFIMQVHPSPRDYFRFSKEALQQLMSIAGFRDVMIEAVGRGPFTASAQITYNPLSKIPLANALNLLQAKILDSLLRLFDRKGTYSKERYPLGYLVVAK